MSASRGRYLSELRRSNAAGIHDARPSRSVMRRLAIQEEMDMSVTFDGDYTQDGDFDDLEPSPEDLAEIEQEEDYVPEGDREDTFYEDDYYLEEGREDRY